MTYEDLKYVRLKDDARLFSLIPRYLFEQVRDREFIVDNLYQLGPLMMVSPLTYLYVMVDKKSNVIKGVLWAEKSVATNFLVVNVLSVDKEYQGPGMLDSTLKKLREVQKENELTKIQMSTTRPKAYIKKQGWKQSKHITLEI